MTPELNLLLNDYVNSYKSRFDKHYKNAVKKFTK